MASIQLISTVSTSDPVRRHDHITAMAMATPTSNGGSNDDDEENEYYKYDSFAGVDLDSIPELAAPTSQAAQHSCSDAHSSRLCQCMQPKGLKPLSTDSHQRNADQLASKLPALVSRGSSPSTQYSDDAVYDADFLAQLDSLESVILQRTDVPSMYHHTLNDNDK